jgi:hypothetical protein
MGHRTLAFGRVFGRRRLVLGLASALLVATSSAVPLVSLPVADAAITRHSCVLEGLNRRTAIPPYYYAVRMTAAGVCATTGDGGRAQVTLVAKDHCHEFQKPFCYAEPLYQRMNVDVTSVSSSGVTRPAKQIWVLVQQALYTYTYNVFDRLCADATCSTVKPGQRRGVAAWTFTYQGLCSPQMCPNGDRPVVMSLTAGWSGPPG